jgi:hypothetical protein
MNALLQTLAFEVLRYSTMAYDKAMDLWNSFWDWYSYTPTISPTRRYFLSDDHVFNDSYGKVPPDTIYIEEWIRRGEKKCVVLYENETIPIGWLLDPFSYHARCPWLWIGDRSTEIDLTRTFQKFLVPGNVLKMDLIKKLIHVTEHTKLVYIEAGTFDEVEFPAEGLLIKANGDE